MIERIYVASRASVLARGAMWRAERAAGAPIISTWIDEDGENDTADLDELWVRICREVSTAQRLVLYVEPTDFPLKGAFVEIGMALAARVPIVVVAPDVKIEGRNCRPFGSWIRHPLVCFADSVWTAFATDTASLSALSPSALGLRYIEAGHALNRVLAELDAIRTEAASRPCPGLGVLLPQLP